MEWRSGGAPVPPRACLLCTLLWALGSGCARIRVSRAYYVKLRVIREGGCGN
jgi:hypothetical protein